MALSNGDVGAVIGIDPGRAKCGIALVRPIEPVHIERSVVPTDQLIVTISRLLRTNPDTRLILIGSGTGSGTLVRALRQAVPNVPVQPVDERGTSLLARERYLKEHPSTGWERLIPSSLRVPPVPYDDYAALLLVERFLAQSGENRTQ